MLFRSSIKNILRSTNSLVRENYLLRKLEEEVFWGAVRLLVTKVLFAANFLWGSEVFTGLDRWLADFDSFF